MKTAKERYERISSFIQQIG